LTNAVQEIFAVYSEYHNKPVGAPCWQSTELLEVKAGAVYIYHYALNTWLINCVHI
jgi:hypothetical protein